MQGASPLASPALNPLRHWLSLPLWKTQWGEFPLRHLFAQPRGRGPSQTPKFLSPGPPLSLAAGFAHREPSPFVFAENRGFSPPAWYLLGRFCKCRLWLSRGDARGEAPCIRKQKNSPFPPGRGAGGWGQKRKLKAGAAGDKEGKPPIAFSTAAGIASAARVQPPWVPVRQAL